MAAENNHDYTAPTYGNWRIPRTAGLGKLSGVATFMLFGLILVAMFVMQFAGIIAAVAFIIPAGLVLVGITWEDKHGVSLLERAGERGQFMFRKKTKRNQLRNGVLGMNEQGGFRIPGVAASSEAFTAKDSFDREFVLIHHRAVSTFAVSISVEPDGSSMVDEQAVDQWVANWGGFLGSLGRETGLIGASATVETAPGSGVRVRKEIESSMSEHASDIARQMLAEAAETYPAGASQIRCWVTLTFSAAPRPGMKKRTPEEMARELATKLPAFTGRLESTGAGVATPMTLSEVTEIVRVAFDPAAARIFEDAFYSGGEIDVPWSECGPSAHSAEWNGYRHDSGISCCWTMTDAPRGHTFSNVLGRLLEPHRDIGRKRVTLIFRPVEASRTADVVEKDQNAASARASSSRGAPSARAAVDVQAANATAKEEARGAGLLFFGLLISATVQDEEQLIDAVAAVEQELAPASRISLRRAFNAHDAVFAGTLPLGIVLGRHTLVPESVKVAL